MLNMSTGDIYHENITTSGFAFDMHKATEAMEASQFYSEAQGWVDLQEIDKEVEPIDTSEDWKIRPYDVMNPKLREEWNKNNLWIMDYMDGMLGDDAMPACCAGCNGMFWGDEMVSIRSTISKLRKKHKALNAAMGGLQNIWDETEQNIVNKIRAHRLCKKCFNVADGTRNEPVSVTTTVAKYGTSIPVYTTQVPNIYGNGWGSNNIVCSGMSPNSYTLTYSSNNTSGK